MCNIWHGIALFRDKDIQGECIERLSRNTSCDFILPDNPFTLRHAFTRQLDIHTAAMFSPETHSLHSAMRQQQCVHMSNKPCAF